MVPALAQLGQARHERAGRRVVQSGERLVEQHHARAVDEGTFERDALTHAA